MSYRLGGTRCPARTGSGSVGEEMGRQDVCPGLGHLSAPRVEARGRSAEKLSSRELGGASPEDTGRQLPAASLGFGICRTACPFADGLRHLESAVRRFGICRAACAFAKGLRHLPDAVWQFGKCRGGLAFAGCRLGPGHLSACGPRSDICPQRFSARTNVRRGFRLGHLSAQISGPDICPRLSGARTFVCSVFGAGHLSAALSQRDICPPVSGAVAVASQRGACLVRGRSGVGQGSVRASRFCKIMSL
jgi:hypothetical protein